MGHYLSDFETNDEFRSRTVLSPRLEILRRWAEEKRRGIVHTQSWDNKMDKHMEGLRREGDFWNQAVERLSLEERDY